MTFITQPKKEGEEKTCECGAELVGRLTDYKGRFPDKLQWQDKESRKAHYDKDGNCKDSTITQESIVEIATTPIQTDYLPDGDKKSIKNTAQILWHIRIQVEQTIKDLEVNPNPAMIGQFVGIIWNELFSERRNSND